MASIAASGKFGVSRFLINSDTGDAAAKGHHYCVSVVVPASIFLPPVAVLAIAPSLESTDDVQGGRPFSQVRPPLSLPGGCTYQVQPPTAPIRGLTCLNTDKPEKASWIEAKLTLKCQNGRAGGSLVALTAGLSVFGEAVRVRSESHDSRPTAGLRPAGAVVPQGQEEARQEQGLSAHWALAGGEDGFVQLRLRDVDRGRSASAVRPGRPMPGAGDALPLRQAVIPVFCGQRFSAGDVG